jgi:hypothetical protein
MVPRRQSEKYGLFAPMKGRMPIEEYEGDQMVLVGDFAKILKDGGPEYGPGTMLEVAVIRLDKGQSIRELPPARRES